MARHSVQRNAFGQLRLDIGNILFDDLDPIRNRRRVAEELFIHARHDPRVFIRSPSQHNAVHIIKRALRRIQTFQPAIEDDFQVRERCFEVKDDIVAQRRDFPVLLWAQP